MLENPLLGLERAAKEVLDTLAPSVIGARIRRERLAQGLSIRELASSANLGPNSIVRLEAGMGFRPITLIKVCSALGVHLDRIGSANEDQAVAVHRHLDDRWHDLDGYAEGNLGGGDGVLDAEGRLAAIRETSGNPLMLLQSRLASGKLLPTLIEVHHPTPTRSHPGEEFVYVLQGPVRISVASRDYVLETGESMDFWGSEPHSYSPVGELGLVLSVRVNP